MNNKSIPQHVALIMDGNRRWAREQKLPVLKGHEAGVKKIEPLISFAWQKGIKYITFWAFSSENWERGKIEVGFLMTVFRAFLNSSIVARSIEKGVKLNVIGDYLAFPKDIVQGVENVLEQSKNNTAITATFALNYGGRQELLKAINSLLNQEKKEVDENTFASYLYTADLPDPDIIIRTGGEQRLSGFLPWQGVYSELFFTDTYWPDFNEAEFEKVLEEYEMRERRFGK